MDYAKQNIVKHLNKIVNDRCHINVHKTVQLLRQGKSVEMQ